MVVNVYPAIRHAPQGSDEIGKNKKANPIGLAFLFESMVVMGRIELPTCGLCIHRSNQLSYITTP